MSLVFYLIILYIMINTKFTCPINLIISYKIIFNDGKYNLIDIYIFNLYFYII